MVINSKTDLYIFNVAQYIFYDIRYVPITRVYIHDK